MLQANQGTLTGIAISTTMVTN
jgi:hypothetical protein